MDIVKAFADQSFNEESEARGLNPIAIGDQNNRLGAVIGVLLRSGSRFRSRGLSGFSSFLSFPTSPFAQYILQIGDQARRQQIGFHRSGSHNTWERWIGRKIDDLGSGSVYRNQNQNPRERKGEKGEGGNKELRLKRGWVI